MTYGVDCTVVQELDKTAVTYGVGTVVSSWIRPQ